MWFKLNVQEIPPVHKAKNCVFLSKQLLPNIINHYIHLLLRIIAISIHVSLWLFSPKLLRRGERFQHIPALFLYVQETAKFCGCTLKILLFSEATWATVVLTDACPRQLHVTAMNIIHVTATSGKKKKKDKLNVNSISKSSTLNIRPVPSLRGFLQQKHCTIFSSGFLGQRW